MVHIANLVSQQTLEKFRIYERLLKEWNRRTALVQEDTLGDFYTRHILDSLQVIPIIAADQFKLSSSACNIISSHFDGSIKMDNLDERISQFVILDVGTGAGFPGLVLAMCGFTSVVLCESNHRKCIFLEEVARQTNTPVRIINDRVENVVTKFDIILSRAFSDLDTLCSLVNRLSATPLALGIFHKGKTWDNEVSMARRRWSFDLKSFESITSNQSVILSISNSNPL